jgi:squalene synthase HpnC
VDFLAPRDFVRSPEAMGRRWDREASLAYTRWLATRHYENFTVVSFLLPRHLHQDFFNVYAFCRWADDLGDEIGDPAESLRLLAWWRQELSGMYRSAAAHPVFVALAETARLRALPEEPFADLITAFEQDQHVSRYQNWEELTRYCHYSANPVGRLVLMLCGYHDEVRFRLSDATCTGLQLANFWQDVTIDWQKDRVYLPQDLLARHGSGDQEIARREATPSFRAAMKEAVDLARGFFLEGLPLAATLDRRLRVDIELFSRGGMAVLDKIERQSYDVLTARPKVSKLDKLVIFARCLLAGGLGGRPAKGKLR